MTFHLLQTDHKTSCLEDSENQFMFGALKQRKEKKYGRKTSAVKVTDMEE